MVDLNGENGSKPVYVGKEEGESTPASRIIGCFLILSIVTLSIVCLIVIWAVTR